MSKAYDIREVLREFNRREKLRKYRPYDLILQDDIEIVSPRFENEDDAKKYMMAHLEKFAPDLWESGAHYYLRECYIFELEYNEDEGEFVWVDYESGPEYTMDGLIEKMDERKRY